MAGAAAVFAAVAAISQLGLRIKVDGWLALAENMPSGSATRRGDVLRMYGGKTVEVLNTDAGGRIVLADNGPVQIVSTGHSKVLLELRDHATVDALRPDPAMLTALSHEVGSNGFFVFTRATGNASLLTWSRMFAPAIGIIEDPVTGNGHGPLGAYLVRHSIVPAPHGKLTFTGRQGQAMGRPGDVRVDVETQPDDNLLVSITGNAATAFRAELHLPDA